LDTKNRRPRGCVSRTRGPHEPVWFRTKICVRSPGLRPVALPEDDGEATSSLFRRPRAARVETIVSTKILARPRGLTLKMVSNLFLTNFYIGSIMTKTVWVGISCNFMPPEVRKLYPRKHLQYGEGALIESIARAGGVPVLLPFLEPILSPKETAKVLLERIDAVLIAGGADIDPSLYREELADERWQGHPLRDRLEIALIEEAIHQKKPLLGICRGHQMLNVALGGSLVQDLPSMRPGEITHRDQETYDKLGHNITVAPNNHLARLIGDGPQWVNSVHHQGIKELSTSLVATAFAPDGLIEAVEGEGCLGVQWHPEWMQDKESGRAIFRDLIERARS
jgi:putative glutamine amidotransferase